MKIAIVAHVNLGQCGGLEALLRALGPVYRELKIDFDTFVPFSNRGKDDQGEYNLRLFWPATISMGIRFQRMARILLAPYFRRVLAGYDLVHVHGAYPLGVLLAPHLQASNLRSVLHCHAVDIQVYPEIGYGVRLDARVDNAIRETIGAYDAIIAANTNIKEQAISMGVPESRINIIYNGTSLEKFLPAMNASHLRQELGIGDGELLLVSAGRNHPVKGFSFALSALALCKHQGRPFKYAILGSGAMQLSQEVARLGLSDQVILNETVTGDRLLAVMRAADLYLLPSLIEGFPLVKAEALAAGLPVITTDTPGCRDGLEDGKNGLITARDTAAYGRAIEKLLQDDDLRRSMSLNARASAKAFDWTCIVGQYRDVYEKVLAE